jgi:predicted O-methyltransferase YrrM
MARDPMTPSGGTYLLRASKAALAHPRDALEKVLERAAGRRERRRRHGERPQSEPDRDWERRLHELIGAAWPCRDAQAFAAVWASATEAMAARGLSMGRESYGDDDDADPGLARALWCLVCHLHANQVVETGVAHGLSSRVMLEALERVGDGRLASIDLPAMTIHERRAEIGAAVPARLRGRWTYLEGSSRRRLPPLLRRLGQVDLFVHDSLHSTRNVRFELAKAWQALRPGGVVVVDDVDFNWGFEEFVAAGDDREPLSCMADDGQRVFALARKRAGS